MYNDIALVKLDRPIAEAHLKKGSVCPICLPKKNFNEIGKTGLVMGWGVVFQRSLHTNGDGPEPYTPCAPGSVMEGEKIKHWEEFSIRNENVTTTVKEYIPGCQQGSPPSMKDKPDNPCLAFNYDKSQLVLKFGLY